MQVVVPVQVDDAHRSPARWCSRSTFWVITPSTTPARSSRARAWWPSFGSVRRMLCQPRWLRAQ